MPKIQQDDDVIVKLVRSSVCGSDLWSFTGKDSKAHDSDNSGHEAIGVVTEAGSALKNIQVGDFVILPFVHGCGKCPACLAGYESGCQTFQDVFSGGYQAEYVRFQHADWALIKIPGQPSDYSDEMLASFQTLSDVMPTGYHAARTAGVKEGDTVAVIGDGAVGLSAVIGAKLRGAKRIILLSHHEDRAELGKEFGATDIVSSRGDEAVKDVLELTDGFGVDRILECVGNRSCLEQAIAIARPGASIGRVGIPHDATFDLGGVVFFKNLHIAGGPASVTTYDREVLLDAVLKGKINPGKVFTKTYKLDEIQAAYESMADRQVIKSLIKF